MSYSAISPAHENRICEHDARGQQASVHHIQQRDDGGDDSHEQRDHGEGHARLASGVVDKEVRQAQT